jgi:hypothetical protein
MATTSVITDRNRLRHAVGAAVAALAIGVFAGSLAGCGSTSRLEPAPGTAVVPGESDAALVTSSGVSISIDPGGWAGEPVNLEEIVESFEVTVQNRSNHPLRLRYDDFQLTTSQGFTSAAIPPYQIRGTVTDQTAVADPVLVPRYRYDRFLIAPGYWGYYPSMPRWTSAWTHDPVYYDRYYPTWQVSMPTRDMMELALPEGVLEPQGSVTGHLFFQKLPLEATGAHFKATLIDATTGQPFGTLNVPFVAG